MKKIEAWALMSADGVRIAGCFGSSPDFGYVAKDETVVRLVPHDPRATRVVRAAVKYASHLEGEETTLSGDELCGRLLDAVSALRKGKK